MAPPRDVLQGNTLPPVAPPLPRAQAMSAKDFHTRQASGAPFRGDDEPGYLITYPPSPEYPSGMEAWSKRADWENVEAIREQSQY